MPGIVDKFKKLGIEVEHFEFHDFGKFTIEEERRLLIHPGLYKRVNAFPMIFLFVKKTWDNKKTTLVGEDVSSMRGNLKTLDEIAKKYENKTIHIPVPFILRPREVIERKPIPESEKKIIIRDRPTPVVEELE
jgi:hypothetical protein